MGGARRLAGACLLLCARLAVSEHEHKQEHSRSFRHHDSDDAVVTIADALDETPVDDNYILGGAFLTFVLILGFGWFKLWLINTAKELDPPRFHWYIAFSCLWLCMGLQFLPMMMLPFGLVVSDIGLPWLCHCCYALTLVLATPLLALGDAKGRKDRLQQLRVPLCGLQGSLASEIWLYIVTVLYTADTYLDCMICAMAWAIGFSKAWLLLVVVDLGVCAPWLVMRLTSKNTMINFAIHGNWRLEPHIMALTGFNPEVFAIEDQATQALARCITQNLPQFALGLLLGIEKHGGVVIFGSAFLSLIFALKQAYMGLTQLGCLEVSYKPLPARELDGGLTTTHQRYTMPAPSRDSGSAASSGSMPGPSPSGGYLAGPSPRSAGISTPTGAAPKSAAGPPATAVKPY
eukprot:TRINITY_DN11966_c0_g1_i1.p1 TRINITY_DN11966_c0_g1~~TRINITY_DN11966_c0_g1_i1.p1  ORF type:complete len:424 (-),score=57.43 TRINITY_DN11966_c0_g1_i1:220-1431(-)